MTPPDMIRSLSSTRTTPRGSAVPAAMSATVACRWHMARIRRCSGVRRCGSSSSALAAGHRDHHRHHVEHLAVGGLGAAAGHRVRADHRPGRRGAPTGRRRRGSGGRRGGNCRRAAPVTPPRPGLTGNRRVRHQVRPGPLDQHRHLVGDHARVRVGRAQRGQAAALARRDDEQQALLELDHRLADPARPGTARRCRSPGSAGRRRPPTGARRPPWTGRARPRAAGRPWTG